MSVYALKRLHTGDTVPVRKLLEMFRVAFGEPESDRDLLPEDDYLTSLLADPRCIVLVAEDVDGAVVGGLVAYELRKFEQARSELYLYDLAVRESYRRQGIATALIEKLKQIGKTVGAYVIFVQADTVDKPAVALYTKLCSLVESELVHFDIDVDA